MTAPAASRRRPHRRRATALTPWLVPLLGLALAACGGTTTDAGTPGSATTASSAGSTPSFTPATSGTLRLYTWSDYIPKSLVDRFSKETGIRMSVDYYDSNETLEAKLKASGGKGYDLVVPSDYMVQTLRDENLLQEFDATSLPNGKNIGGSFLDVYFDPGRKFSVPYLYGTTGYAYDPAVVKTPMKSWKDYFSAPAEARGKIGIFNDQVDGINAALRAVGGEPCTTDPAKLQAAQDLLVSFKASVATINSDGIIDRMQAGESPLSMIWNGAAHRVKAKKKDVVYVYPTEGMTLWQDNFAIPSGAENVDQAKTFLNWFMDPKNAAEAANAQGYNSGITGVDDLLTAQMRQDPAVVPPAEAAAVAKPVKPCTAAELNNYSKIWERFKA
jgi:spermidine/putrescine transport system substrate-binding protein